MSRPIGYYVHHHGDGHRQRALALATHMEGRVTLLGTGLSGRTGDIACLDLPDDRLPGGGFDGQDGTGRPASLHYAPLDHEGLRQRAALLTGWIARERPALIVVDVSVEVAMLARLASVPTVYVRLGGRRLDRPHLDAFRGAEAMLVPFHPDLDEEDLPRALRERSVYAPGLGHRTEPASANPDLILGVVGRGGGQSDGERWADAAHATPWLRWDVIGPCTVPAHMPPNLSLLGWIEDAPVRIARAGVVVGAAGDGLVSTVLATRRPFICLSEERPFAEQQVKARRLAAVGAAISCDNWPESGDWPALLDRARRIAPEAMARLDDPDGNRRTAAWLLDLADRLSGEGAQPLRTTL